MASPSTLTDGGALTPLHACLARQPDLPWSHLATDGLTTLAYWSVPIALAMTLQKSRSALARPSRAAFLVVCFAVAAGAAHAASILDLCRPEQAFEGAVKAAMALSAAPALQNAREAILRRRQAEPEAPARVTVCLQPGTAPGTVAVAVCDTGGGVPASVAPHILEPFVTTKEPGEGTGLGLPVVVGIARGMGGRLSWSNVAFGKPEAGAVFRLVFPSAASGAAGAARGRAA